MYIFFYADSFFSTDSVLWKKLNILFIRIYCIEFKQNKTETMQRHSTASKARKFNSLKINSIKKFFQEDNLFIKKTNEDVYKTILIACRTGFGDYNVVMETNEGVLLTHSSKVNEILKQMLKYRQEGKWNGTIQDVSIYKDDMTNIVNIKKIAILYICGQKGDADFGASMMYGIDEKAFEESIRYLKVHVLMSQLGLLKQM